MLGWVGNGFIVAGLYGIGDKRRGAFLLTLAGELIWTLNAAIRAQQGGGK